MKIKYYLYFLVIFLVFYGGFTYATYYIDRDVDTFSYTYPYTGESLYGMVEVLGRFYQPFEYFYEEWYYSLYNDINPAYITPKWWKFYYYSENNVTCEYTSYVFLCDADAQAQGQCSLRMAWDSGSYNQIRHYVYGRLTYQVIELPHFTTRTWVAEASVGSTSCQGGGCPLLYVEQKPGLFVSISKVKGSPYGPSVSIINVNLNETFIYPDGKIRIAIGALIPSLKGKEIVYLGGVFINIRSNGSNLKVLPFNSTLYLMDNEVNVMSFNSPSSIVMLNPSFLILEFDVSKLSTSSTNSINLVVVLNRVIK